MYACDKVGDIFFKLFMSVPSHPLPGSSVQIKFEAETLILSEMWDVCLPMLKKRKSQSKTTSVQLAEFETHKTSSMPYVFCVFKNVATYCLFLFFSAQKPDYS